MRKDRERLLDILEAVEKIEKYAERGRDAIRDNELIQSWITRHLQIIGEAARALSQEFRDSTPQIPWPDIIGMRHVLVHRYFDVDPDIVWKVVAEDLPVLKELIQVIISDFDENQ